jgi:hypothetical protein
MAPELFLGYPPSAASDQWAWAAVLVELVTGETPYGTDDPKEVMERARRFDPRSISLGGAGREALRRSLDPTPEKRFPDMGAMGAALAETSWSRRARREPARGQALVATVALGSRGPGPERRRFWAGPLVASGVVAGLVGWALSPPPPPIPAALPGPPQPDKEMLRLRRAELDEAERTFRQIFTGGTQAQAWSWLPLWDGTYEEKRLKSRSAFMEAFGGSHWERFAEAVVAMVESCERLPEPERARWAREVYAGPELAQVTEAILGRGTGLAVDMMSDVLSPGLGDGKVVEAFNDVKTVRARFHDSLESVDRLSRQLLELESRSREVRATATWLAFLSRRGDVASRYRRVLAVGPLEDPALEWLIVRNLLRALFRDPQFVRWDNPQALNLTRGCALVPDALTNLGPRVAALAVATQRAEGGVYLWQLEVQARALCPDPVLLDVEAMRARVDGYLEDVALARRTGWPPGDFLRRTADWLKDAQGQMVRRSDPAAAVLADPLASLKELGERR